MTSHQEHQQARATQQHSTAKDNNPLTKAKEYGHSLSGSEPDVSTSTENLSPEERYALEHTQRQEPQGQENVSTANMANTQAPDPVMSGASGMSSHRSNECNASISSSTNTLIIHNSVNDDSWHHRWGLGGYSSSGRKSMSASLLDGQDTGSQQYTSQAHQLNMESLKLNSSLLNTPLTESSAAKSNILSSTLLNSSLLDSSMLSQKTCVPYLNHSSIPGSPKLSSRSSVNYQTSTDLPDIPSSYLDQSEVLKHLLRREGKGSGCSDQSASSSNSGINLIMENNSAVTRDLSQAPLFRDLDSSGSYDLLNLPPPPAYPIWRSKQSEKLEKQGEFGNHTIEKASLSKSQPDLTKINSTKDGSSPKELLSQRVVSGQTDYGDSPMQEVADILAQENSALKLEVDMYHRKVAKLQRFEMEIVKVHEAHQALVKSSERREHLERLARHKLHAEVKRLTELNADLKDQIDVLTTQIASRPLPSDTSDALRKDLNKRDVFIAQLISQNKELIAAKERQEIELAAQKQTLNEQRSHIDILDSALTNAQANVVKLEEELRKKQNIVEQAGQLKRFIVSLQLAADKREQSEKNLRYKLEKEVEALRLGSKQEDPGSKISDLQRELREKEEKIMILEGEVTKWEQRYLQESAMRQLAIDAASMPKDAKIAALEKSNQESERSFSQAKSDKLRQLEEIHNMSKKQVEYEARNRELESHIAEKDAMIRVLQRRVEEKEALYQKALMRTTLGSGKSLDGQSSSNTSVVHSTQASTVHSHSSSGLGCGGVGSSTPVSLGQDLHSLGSVGRSRELGAERRRMDNHNEGGSQSTMAGLNSEAPGSDDLLLDNEDAMLGKLRVVCFPGLVNTSSAAGEGTVSQPLLASVDIHPSLLRPNQQPSSDLSFLGINKGPEHSSSIQTKSYNDISGLPHPQYDSPPAYASDATTRVPSTREFSFLSMTQPQNLPCHSSLSDPRGDPPPYHGHHEVLSQGTTGLQSPSFYPSEHASPPLVPDSPPIHVKRDMISPSTPNLSADMPLPRPPICRNPHHPTVACRKCNSVRSSNRHNAAILVRRANSSVGHGYRNSTPVSSCQVDSDADDTPSILARLRREWEMGNIPSIENPSASKAESPSHSSPENSQFKDKRESATNVKEPCQGQQVSSNNKGQPSQQSDSTNGRSPESLKKEVQYSTSKDKSNKGKLMRQGPTAAGGNAGQDKTVLKYTKSVSSSDNTGPAVASPTTKQNLSFRIQNLFNHQTQGSDSVNKSSGRDYLNNKVNQEQKKNDMNQLNNNQENKIELIILEDADQLKTPKDITKPLQDVI